MATSKQQAAAARRSAANTPAAELPTSGPAQTAGRRGMTDDEIDAQLAALLGLDAARLRLLARHEQGARGGLRSAPQTVRELLRRSLISLAAQFQLLPLGASADGEARTIGVDANDVSPAHAGSRAVQDFENSRRRQQVRGADAQRDVSPAGAAPGTERTAAALAAPQASSQAEEAESFASTRRRRQAEDEVARREPLGARQ